MGIYASYGSMVWLRDIIYDATAATTEQAASFANAVESVAIDVGLMAIESAKAFTNLTEREIRTDIDNSLNAISDWTRDELDIITDTYGVALTTALTSLGEAQSAVGDQIADTFEDTITLVGESYAVASQYVEESVTAASGWVADSVSTVGTWIQDQFDGALAVVNSTIDHILQIPKLLVDYAVENLLPAQGLQWEFLFGKMLMSNPMTAMLYSLKELFVEGLGEFFTIDEAEMADWMKRTFTTLQNLALADVAK